MAAIKVEDISLIKTTVVQDSKLSEAIGLTKPPTPSTTDLTIIAYTEAFLALIGTTPVHALLLDTTSTSKNPFFSTGCVFHPSTSELYTTSALLQGAKSSSYPTVLISRLRLSRSLPPPNAQAGESSADAFVNTGHVTSLEWAKLRPPPGIDMPSGGCSTPEGGTIFTAQGNERAGTGGMYLLPPASRPVPLITNYQGVDFNSPYDVARHRDGSIWFTDGTEGFENDFRGPVKLCRGVYRFDPSTGDCRLMAGDLDRPRGLGFTVDGNGEATLFVVDAGRWTTGVKDVSRPSIVYAYNITTSTGAPFLTNKRVFTYFASGVPRCVKCDWKGNVYVSSGEGIVVFASDGTLQGKILVPGGVGGFCFGVGNEMFLGGETRLWRIVLEGLKNQ